MSSIADPKPFECFECGMKLDDHEVWERNGEDYCLAHIPDDDDWFWGPSDVIR